LIEFVIVVCLIFIGLSTFEKEVEGVIWISFSSFSILI